MCPAFAREILYYKHRELNARVNSLKFKNANIIFSREKFHVRDKSNHQAKAVRNLLQPNFQFILYTSLQNMNTKFII